MQTRFLLSAGFILYDRVIYMINGEKWRSEEYEWLLGEKKEWYAVWEWALYCSILSLLF